MGILSRNRSGGKRGIGIERPLAGGLGNARAARNPLPRRGWRGFFLSGLDGGSGRLSLLVAAGVVPVAGFFLAHFMLQSEYFHVREWDVIGAHRLSVADIERIALGENDAPVNLLALSERRMAERLVESPMVLHAHVRKSWPDGMRVLLHERTEEALVVTSTGTWLADIEGVVFARASAREVLNPALPIITMPEAANLEPGEQLPNGLIANGLLYAHALRDADSEIASLLSEIQWVAGIGITLVLADGARAVCGNLPPDETLPKIEALARLRPGLRDVAWLDARLPSDLPWVPVPVEPPRTTALRR